MLSSPDIKQRYFPTSVAGLALLACNLAGCGGVPDTFPADVPHQTILQDDGTKHVAIENQIQPPSQLYAPTAETDPRAKTHPGCKGVVPVGQNIRKEPRLHSKILFVNADSGIVIDNPEEVPGSADTESVWIAIPEDKGYVFNYRIVCN